MNQGRRIPVKVKASNKATSAAVEYFLYTVIIIQTAIAAFAYKSILRMAEMWPAGIAYFAAAYFSTFALAFLQLHRLHRAKKKMASAGLLPEKIAPHRHPEATDPEIVADDDSRTLEVVPSMPGDEMVAVGSQALAILPRDAVRDAIEIIPTGPAREIIATGRRPVALLPSPAPIAQDPIEDTPADVSDLSDGEAVAAPGTALGLTRAQLAIVLLVFLAALKVFSWVLANVIHR